MPTASELLKATGLLADGPVRWGSPVRAKGPGLFVVELLTPTPPPPPIDVAVCGKWAERVPTLLLDGERPDGKALQRRLASFWIPSQTVLYVAATAKSLSARVGALYANELGSRSPHPGGHWLKTVRGLSETRIWWVETDAVEEAEDAVLEAFAAGVPQAEQEALHDPTVVLPFATLAGVGDRKKETGLTGSLLPAPEAAPSAIRRSSSILGAERRTSASGRAAGGSTRRTAGSSTSRPSAPRATTAKATTSRAASAAEPPKAEPTKLTAEGLARLEGEVNELRDVKRPENVQRIKTAREHGDLRENAEYQEARREQSFIEGRIQALEAILRNVEIVEAGSGHVVEIGSAVTVTHDGEAIQLTIVGTSEASPAEGRISYLSPIGAALLGRRAGDVVSVATPSGARHYRVDKVG